MRRADIEWIVGALQARYPLNDDDVAYVGGSVAEGIATPSSDIDVFVIRDTGRADTDQMHLVALPHSGLPIDLEVWSRHEVTDLLRRLDALHAESATDHRAFMRLTDDERDFLHSLSIAVPLRGENTIRRWQADLDCDLLARMAQMRALMGINNAQTDLLGWLASGDWQSAGVACQRLVEFSGAALLAASGTTHPGGKWVNALLRRDFAGTPLPTRLTAGAASLADRFYALQIRPSQADHVDAYARDCVMFANAAVVYAQLQQPGASDVVVERALWAPTGPTAGTEPCPTPSCAMQLRKDNGRWYLLHVGREMYEINATAAAMVLQLDGRTPIRDVLGVVGANSSADPRSLERSLQDVVNFLDNAGLLVPTETSGLPRLAESR